MFATGNAGRLGAVVGTGIVVLGLVFAGLITPFAASAAPPSKGPTVILLTSGLASGSGSTLGPDGALYVTEGAAGRASRVDAQTGAITTFASGLLIWVFLPIGGAMDVAFIDNTAYVMLTVVGPEIGGNAGDKVGIYRVDGPGSFTVISDIGAFSLANPPIPAFFSPDGQRLAVSGVNHDKAVKLWDVDSWQELLTLENTGSAFLVAAFSPDGNAIGTLSGDGFLHVWQAPSLAEINAAEAKEKAAIKQP